MGSFCPTQIVLSRSKCTKLDESRCSQQKIPGKCNLHRKQCSFILKNLLKTFSVQFEKEKMYHYTYESYLRIKLKQAAKAIFFRDLSYIIINKEHNENNKFSNNKAR